MATKLFEQMYANEHTHQDIVFEEDDIELDEEDIELLKQIEKK